MKKLEAYFAELGPQFVDSIECNEGAPAADVSLLEAVEGSDDNNPFGGLNVGIIEIRDAGDHSTVNLKLVGYPPVEQWNHATMFGSGDL